MTNEQLELALDGEGIEEKEAWHVDSRERAEWAIQKIAFAQKRIDERTENIKKLKARLDERLEEINRADKGAIDFFTHELEPYVARQLEGQKKKSDNFAFGKAGYRMSGGALEVLEEETAIEYLEENHGGEGVKKSILKSEVKRLLKMGSEVPGVEVKEAEQRFYVSPDYSLMIDSDGQ